MYFFNLSNTLLKQQHRDREQVNIVFFFLLLEGCVSICLHLDDLELYSQMCWEARVWEIFYHVKSKLHLHHTNCGSMVLPFKNDLCDLLHYKINTVRLILHLN